MPRRCRECGSSHIRQLGIGTQRVVDEVAALLPGVRVQRWDSDAARGGLDPGETMRKFQSGEIQVLVGTQVVAKGLDVANVTLVGVILADVGLHLPAPYVVASDEDAERLRLEIEENVELLEMLVPIRSILPPALQVVVPDTIGG